MPTDPTTLRRHFSARRALTILAGFALFVVLVQLVRQPMAPVQIEVSQVPEEERWKFDAAARARRLADLRAREAREATTYGWVDQAQGVVRLPIDRAMELTARELAAPRP